jgi:hypothetical protein
LNGGFGTSPFHGQLSGKPLLATAMHIWASG